MKYRIIQIAIFRKRLKRLNQKNENSMLKRLNGRKKKAELGKYLKTQVYSEIRYNLSISNLIKSPAL
jgi:hypothetical protein